MGAGDRNVTLAIDRVFTTQSCNAFENSISQCRVAGRHVKDEIHKSICRVVHIANDESAREYSLP